MKPLIYILLCLFSFQVFTQEPVWMHLDNYSPYNLDYSRIGIDQLNNIYIVSDWGNYSNPYHRASRIIKYLPDGTENWSHIYQGDSTTTRAGFISESGITYITRTISMSFLDQFSIVFAIDNNGNEVFNHVSYDVNYNAIICDNDGNVYVSGHSYEPGCEEKAVLAKFNSVGELLWQSCWDEPCNYSSGRLLVINDSNLFVIGRFDNDQFISLFLAKYNFDGDLIDYKLFNVNPWYLNLLHKALMDFDENIYVLGRYESDEEWWYKGFIYKFNLTLSEIWHDTTSLDYYLFTDLVVDDDKNLILSGYENENYGDQPHATYAKYGEDGNKLWHFTNDSVKSRINSIATYNNNYFLTGRLRNEEKYSYEYYSMRLNTDGQVVDTHILESIDSTHNVGIDNVIDHNGNLICTGIYEDNIEYCLTAKYDAITFKEEILANNLYEFINVYPNPAKTFLNIELSNNDPTTDIFIYTLDGRKVKEVSIVESDSGNPIQIRLAGISTGIYILSIKYPHKIITKKVIITD